MADSADITAATCQAMRRARKQAYRLHGWDATRWAEELRAAGGRTSLSRQAVHHWERGDTEAPAWALVAAASLLETGVDDLLASTCEIEPAPFATAWRVQVRDDFAYRRGWATTQVFRYFLNFRYAMQAVGASGQFQPAALSNALRDVWPKTGGGGLIKNGPLVGVQIRLPAGADRDRVRFELLSAMRELPTSDGPEFRSDAQQRTVTKWFRRKPSSAAKAASEGKRP